MSQMPQIKAEVNKEPQREKKKGGLFGRLFGGGSGGGALGGGMGGAGGLAGGGMLATKAGLMTLILVGTTVAGGIGLVGYRLFGPGQDQGNGDNLQLFAAKPKDAQPAEDPNAASKDGSSKSLEFAAQANTTPKAPEVSAAPAPTDATAGSASSSASADAAAATSGGALNSAGNSSSGVNKNLLKGSGKFGTLSSGFGGSGGGGGSSASSGGASGGRQATEALPTASRNGASTAMKKGLAATGGSRAIASRRGASHSLKQAFGALHDGRGAQTSYAAGHTFDGSAGPGGMNAGPEGGAIGMGGPGAADGPAQPKSLPNNQGDKKEFQAPPTPKSVDAAPWQNAIKTAQGLILLATALMLVAKLCSRTAYGHVVSMIIAAIVAMIGIAVIALGAKIGDGEYGQKMQGAMLAAAGTGLLVMAAATALGGKDSKPDSAGNVTHTDGLGGQSVTAAGPDGPGTGATTGLDQGASAKDAGFFDGVNPLVLVGGGLALVGVCGTAMMPPQKYPSKDFENGNPPDTHWFGYRQAPSEKALAEYLA